MFFKPAPKKEAITAAIDSGNSEAIKALFPNFYHFEQAAENMPEIKPILIKYLLENPDEFDRLSIKAPQVYQLKLLFPEHEVIIHQQFWLPKQKAITAAIDSGNSEAIKALFPNFYHFEQAAENMPEIKPILIKYLLENPDEFDRLSIKAPQVYQLKLLFPKYSDIFDQPTMELVKEKVKRSEPYLSKSQNEISKNKATLFFLSEQDDSLFKVLPDEILETISAMTRSDCHTQKEAQQIAKESADKVVLDNNGQLVINAAAQIGCP